MNQTLGALEETVLLLVLREKETYGAELVKHYVDLMNREITLPAIVMVLKRLEKKGMLKSKMGEPSQKRGGRRKVLYEVTDLGYRATRDTMEAKIKVWNMIPRFT